MHLRLRSIQQLNAEANSMARKQSSVLEDLFAIAATLPWWVGVALAITSYLFFHSVAVTEIAPTAQIGQMGSMVIKNVFKTLSTILQYILPLVFLVGSLASFFKRKQREKLVFEVACNPSASSLNEMRWEEFEMLVGEAFRQQGFTVRETGGGGADGGVDIVLTKDNEKFLVQCKQWRAQKVGVAVVRELYGVMAAEGATGGVVVTSGYFTDEAKKFANGRNVKLLDGKLLHAFLRNTRTEKHHTVFQQNKPTSSGELAPVCPLCSSAMVKRTAKRGGNSGGEFWGCSKFPVCKGIRQTI